MNGQTYWYKIVPVGASRSCIGPVSAAAAAAPQAGTLLILPESLRNWLKGAFQVRKLEAYGGSGNYTWSVFSGTLPAGIVLNAVTGELYGTPTGAAPYDFTIKAVDSTGGSLAGTRRYSLQVVSSMSDLDFVPTVMPFGYVLRSLDIPLTPSGGSNMGYWFKLEEGTLPPGMELWHTQVAPLQWAIKGTPYCAAPCEPRGLYPFVLSLTDSAGHYVERAFELAVLDNSNDFLIHPEQGTTAGGTRVRMYYNAPGLAADMGIKFDLKDLACGASLGQLLAAEATDIIYASSVSDAKIVEVVTPRGLEGCADVKLYSGASLYKTVPDAYRFKTLAYTTNQGSQNIGILDTTDQIPFQPKPAMAFLAPGVPMGIALGKGGKAGRELYVVDSHAGKLVIYDAANFTPIAEIGLQTEIFPTWTASEVEVSEDGTTAYVLHLTDHDIVCPAYPCESSGSISVVDLVNRELTDLDWNEFTTSSNAPPGITRIEIPHDFGLLPLSSEDVYAPKAPDQYAIGDKWPGEYLFVSGVTLLDRIDAPLYACAPGSPCLAATIPVEREPAVIVVDLNPSIVTDIQNGNPVLGLNSDFQDVIKRIDIGGTMGEDFGINQGLDFQVFADSATGQAHVYAISPSKNHMVVIDFETLSLLTDGGGRPLTLGTGLHPTDVKVQKVTLSKTPLVEKTYAFVTNAGEDTISEIDTAELRPSSTWPKIALDTCRTADHFPASFDTRGAGDYGFTANFNSASVSVVDLKAGACRVVGAEGTISVGLNPLRIAIAPMYSLDQISAAVQTAVEYAVPADFTEPAKQPTLLRDWEAVERLEETQATPQAVLSNVKNFEKNVEKWVVKEELKSSLSRLSILYGAAYAKDNPTAGGQ